MSESERGGAWSPLSNPIIYEAFHHLIGARRWLRSFARDTVAARDDERILDIGCGPGALLAYLPASTHYVGLDLNHACIERARKRYGSRGEFICDDVGNLDKHAVAQFDIAVAIGLLHHLDNDAAVALLRSTASALKPGGRFITVDPCFFNKQDWLQRFVNRHDRGKHVRPFVEYVDLCIGIFSHRTASYVSGYLPFPQSVCILEARCE